MAHSGKHTDQKSTLTQTLRAVLGSGLLIVLSACGGGGGAAGVGSGTAVAPVQLGAALPVDGDFIAIEQESLSVHESTRAASIVVARRGNAVGASSVQYRFVAGSAEARSDFRGVDGTLTWADGESGNRTVSFLVESDLISESAETFHIELFAVTGTDELGVNDSLPVTINDSPCGATVPASTSANMVLSAPCYQLNGAANFGPSGQLSISPGTTIIASAGSSMTFSGSSTLNAEGSALLPVVIKGAGGTTGMWNGLALQSTSALHRISHTEIRDATNAVTVLNGAVALFDKNRLDNNSGAGVVLPMADVETLGTQNTFIDTLRGIEIVGRDIDEGETAYLPAQSTHYVLSNGLIINGALKLAAGTDLRMGADVPVLVLGNGAISALGTVDNPINISGVEPRQGYWNGIQYASASNMANRLEHVTVAHGGGDPARAGNIIVDGLDTTITMKNCALNHSAGYGIVYDSLSFQVDLTDVSFDQNRLGEHSM